MRRTGLLVAVAVAASMAGGCSDGDNKQAAPTASPPVNSTTEPTFSGTGASPFCAQVGALEVRLSELLMSTGPDAARNLFAAAQEGVTSMAAAAPAEIRGDVNLIAAFYRQLLDGLAQADFDPARLPTAVVGATPETRAAGERLDVYKRKVCQGVP